MRVLSALVFASLMAAQPAWDPKPGHGPLYPILRERKWGYIDRQGNMIIQPQFARAVGFYNGLAAVSANGKTGFIDERGVFLIPPQFDEVGDFSGILAPVRIGRKWGFVDRAGSIVVEPQFQAAASFHDGLARVLVWERLDCGNQEFTKDNADEGEFTFSKGDFIPCFALDEKYGFVGEDGKLVVEPQFPFAADAADGRARVQVGEGQDAKYGYLDRTGTMVIPPIFKWAENFQESLAPARLDKKWGYIDVSGAFVIPAQYDRAYGFENGIAFAQPGDYIDRSGKTVPGPTVFPVPKYVNGIAIVRRGGHYLYVDTAGREIAPYD